MPWFAVGEIVCSYYYRMMTTHRKKTNEVVNEPEKTKVQEQKAKAEPVTVSSAVQAIEEKPVVQSEETKATRFYSPLVLSIANSEQVSLTELETIEGSGLNNRPPEKRYTELH